MVNIIAQCSNEFPNIKSFSYTKDEIFITLRDNSTLKGKLEVDLETSIRKILD